MAGLRSLPAVSRLSAAVIVATLALVLAVPAPAQQKRDDYLNTPGAAAAAVARLVKEIGRTPAVSRITIEPDRITLLVQGKNRPHDVDAWVATRSRGLFGGESVSGPKASRTDTIVAEAEGGFFPLRDIALADLTDVVAAAVKRAGLEDPGRVESVTIDRRVSIVPRPAYGNVRWAISVTSDRESATVYADPSGRIYAADLSQTNRARRLDLVARDDWPMQQAKEELLAVIGPGKIVHEVRVYNSYLFIVADHPSDPDQTRDYSWDLSGVRRGIVDSPNVARRMGDTAPFSLTELDFTKLPQIKAAARAALRMPDDKITSIKAQKSTTGARQPEVRWTVEITVSGRERGVATVSTSGEVIGASLPPGRRPVEPSLAPATILKTLAHIKAEFGPAAKFHEIMINDSKAHILVEDPRRPGTMASFIVDGQRISRFGSATMPYDARPDPRRVFTLEDLKPLTEAMLAEFAARTLKRLNLEGTEVHRYTISRGGILSPPSPRGLPIIEIRAGEKERGGRNGWVVFDLSGAEIDVMMP